MTNSKILNGFFSNIEKNILKSGAAVNRKLEADLNFLAKINGKLNLLNKDSEWDSELLLEELLKGGHLKFEDGGFFYQEIIQDFKHNIKPRMSSHDSYKQQYSLSGPIFKEILFGVSKEGYKLQLARDKRPADNEMEPNKLYLYLLPYISPINLLKSPHYN